MQGRLSRRPNDRIQAFPRNTWKEEFVLARELGLANIEWLFEVDDYQNNPIWTKEDDSIKKLFDATGVKVRSVCADYFMPKRLFNLPQSEIEENIDVLIELIQKSSIVGAEVILLPVLEISEVKSVNDKIELIENLQRPLDIAQSLNIKLGLETELPAFEYRELVERANHPSLGVYYDTGNAAAKGYNIEEDLKLLAPLLCGVHIKDRTLNGSSVMLGEGRANFKGFFRRLNQLDYNGPLVLQSWFGDKHLNDALANLTFVKEHLQIELAGQHG